MLLQMHVEAGSLDCEVSLHFKHIDDNSILVHVRDAPVNVPNRRANPIR